MYNLYRYQTIRNEYRRQYSYFVSCKFPEIMHITMKIHVYNSPCITPVIQYLEVWNTAFNNNLQTYFEFKLPMKGKMIFINIRLSIHIDFQFYNNYHHDIV